MTTKDIMGELVIASERELEALRAQLETERAARATAEGSLTAEREARQRAETALETERGARMASEAARGAAEQRAQPQPAPVTTVVETARKPVVWKVEGRRQDGTPFAMTLTPEERK